MKKIIITILLTASICSCGSRKMNKSKTEEIAKSETFLKNENNQKTNLVIEKDLVDESKIVSENDIAEFEENLVPIDPDKPIEKTESIEGNVKKTTWKNTTVSKKSKKDNSKTVTNNRISDNSNISNKLEISEISETSSKKSENKLSENKKLDVKRGFNWWWLLVLIPVVLIYRFRKKIVEFI